MGIRNVNTNPWHQQHKEVKFGFPAITSLLISLFQIVLQFLVAIADGVEERVVTVRCALLPLRLIRFSYSSYATTIAIVLPFLLILELRCYLIRYATTICASSAATTLLQIVPVVARSMTISPGILQTVP